MICAVGWLSPTSRLPLKAPRGSAPSPPCKSALLAPSFSSQHEVSQGSVMQRAVQEMLQGCFLLHVISAVCCFASPGHPAPEKVNRNTGLTPFHGSKMNGVCLIPSLSFYLCWRIFSLLLGKPRCTPSACLMIFDMIERPPKIPSDCIVFN